MKDPNPYRCDVCQRHKDPTNRWWMIWELLYIDTETYGAKGPALQVFEWYDKLADSVEIKHICSQECTAKYIAGWQSKLQAVVPAKV